ncbi:nicotinamide riboside transporter PnuC [Trichocoleus sp. FACHB-262]|uniref:nicotinamide riboside transporter PnuC n=1 Tax=Trichocoleus sp. FACHB-262 TaxID=2692869 RepID=UPI0016868573|nr:nicotinamide riboside transporter PnuC [Trichocoleus sp. FACHB-262]MBD2121292.1 nicotinamide mononucleotide transporter [Trichocoleus sp. FACHB-262]
MPQSTALSYSLGVIASLVLLLLPLQRWIPIELSWVETIAAVSYAWSVWLLAQNKPVGWWIGLVGTALYGLVFYQAQLYAEVGLQAFYFITSVQAIYIWLRGGHNQTEKPIGHVSRQGLLITAGLAIAAIFILRSFLIAIRGAAPFWDALTTMMSLVAHLYLMGRYVESWYLWITVDVIYVPLYASRSLYLTSLLYGVFSFMAFRGLRNFQRLELEQQLQATEQ